MKRRLEFSVHFKSIHELAFIYGDIQFSLEQVIFKCLNEIWDWSIQITLHSSYI